MVFSSSIFLLVFLPIVLAAYFVVPNRTWRNLVLLVSSLVFYAWGEPVYVVLMIASIAVNWAAGVAIGALPNAKRLVLVVDVVVNVLLIGFFKYEAFLARTVNAVIGSPIVPELDLPLPIGISFYTLQAQSYVIDVYRGDVPPEKNPWILGMYVAMFPQLVAGPIVRYSTILDQCAIARNRCGNSLQACGCSPSGLRKRCFSPTSSPSLRRTCWRKAAPRSGQWAPGRAS